MEIKWFFVIIGLFLTFAILIGMYFITNFALLQQQKYYEDSQKTAIQRFDNSTLVHDFLFKNITDLKKGLDPILATIKNATEMKRQQQEHYNQTAEDFIKIQQVLKIKLQDHITLGQMNQTVNQILGILNNDSGSVPVAPISPVPAPIIENDSGIIVENITDVSEGGKDKALVLLSNQ